MGGWAKWGMRIKEGTCWDEPWVLYVSHESPGSTPEAKTSLHVNSLEPKKKGKENNMKENSRLGGTRTCYPWNSVTQRGPVVILLVN